MLQRVENESYAMGVNDEIKMTRQSNQLVKSWVFSLIAESEKAKRFAGLKLEKQSQRLTRQSELISNQLKQIQYS